MGGTMKNSGYELSNFRTFSLYIHLFYPARQLNGSLYVIKHKQTTKISYSFILYPVSSIFPSSLNRHYSHFSNFNTSFPQRYHPTSCSPNCALPMLLSNYIT